MPDFTKGKWLIHEGYFHEITLNPKQYYIYPDCGEPYTDDFIVCAEEADARLIAAAPDMYRTLVKILDDTQNGQFADENKLIALLNSIDEENREFNYMYPIP